MKTRYFCLSLRFPWRDKNGSSRKVRGISVLQHESLWSLHSDNCKNTTETAHFFPCEGKIPLTVHENYPKSSCVQTVQGLMHMREDTRFSGIFIFRYCRWTFSAQNSESWNWAEIFSTEFSDISKSLDSCWIVSAEIENHQNRAEILFYISITFCHPRTFREEPIF